jgi:hypothetical protein
MRWTSHFMVSSALLIVMLKHSCQSPSLHIHIPGRKELGREQMARSTGKATLFPCKGLLSSEAHLQYPSTAHWPELGYPQIKGGWAASRT